MKKKIFFAVLTLILAFILSNFSISKGLSYEFSFLVNILILIFFPFFIKKEKYIYNSLILLAIFPLMQIIFKNNLCNIFIGSQFFIFLPLSTLFLIFYMIKFLEINKFALIKYFSIIFLFLILEIYIIYFRPQIFIYNIFWGYFQGSLYDSEIKISNALIYLSIWKIFITIFFYLHIKKKNTFKKVIYYFSILAIISIFIFQENLGLKSSKKYLQSKLKLYQSKNFNIYYPKEYDIKKMDILFKEHEFYLKELKEKLDIKETEKIYSYVFKNSYHKKELMGAGNTLIAKVWLNSIFINYESFPHKHLKHEISHVLLGKLKNNFLKVPMRNKIYPLIGLIEGFAVWLEDKYEELSLDEKMFILKETKKFPNIKKMLSPTGFWNFNSYYSYKSLGAFISFLENKYGIEKIKQLYQKENFKKVYKKDLKILEKEYYNYLNDIKIPKRYMPSFKKMLHRKAYFKKICHNDLTQMKRKINLSIKNKDKKSINLSNNLISLAPNSSSYYFYILNSAISNKNFKIFNYFSKKLEKLKLNKNENIRLLSLKAHIYFYKEKYEKAYKLLNKILSYKLDNNLFRTIYIQNSSLKLCLEENSCNLKNLVYDYIIKRKNIKEYIVRFNKIEPLNKEKDIINYLYGRYHYNYGHYEEAIFFLEQISDSIIKEINIERYKLLIKSRFLKNQREETIIDCKKLIEISDTQGIKNFAKRYITFSKNFPNSNN